MKKYLTIIDNKLFLFLIYIILLITQTYSYVLIPLTKLKSSTTNEYSPELLINNLYNQYYGLLNIGNPPQKTEIQISSEYYGLIMKENICLTLNYYNKTKSLSLKEIYFINFNQTIEINETIDFPIINSTNNISSINTIPNYNFIYYKSNTSELNEDKSCIIFGLKLMCGIGMMICNNIPNYLKRSGLTSSQNFFFLFNKENNLYNNSIVIGENPHEYNSKVYHESNYIKSKAIYWKGELTWTLRFKNYYYLNNEKIYFHYNKKEDQIHGTFLFDLDIIIGIKDYFESIKLNYFDKYKKECNIDIIFSHYNVISCNKNFNIETFPTLYFYHVDDYNFTFELNYKDLFEIRGDKKYFLIVFDLDSDYPWKFGKVFIQKYFFNFEVDSKSIGFYNDLNYDSKSDDNKNDGKKDNHKSSNTYLWIIWVIILIITGIGCFILGKKLYEKNRKKRANELDDDYDYVQKNKEENLTNDSNENKLGINPN